MDKNVRYQIAPNKKRIMILAWVPAGHDHDEGWYEIGHVKLSSSKNSLMDDWNLEEIRANLLL
ncbi:hypothetical protein I6N95_05080 [Vagococcus sp. BWB3-3]|uniref:Uncharacterized protein n=1 Tax=Vagococcus allomyrinae TaxID=2794353 RepID=A0A940PAC6_9ENTE|nr:hypothetical protein [Vagococcus allomyrinae]MBP1040383.1 hypothetical protein [Vagococcus allomyrinae]